jgi:glycosyltransferase involved in cell wall biosynthesis
MSEERRLRILLATDSYPPFVGGADRQTHRLAHSMADRGHRVSVVTPWQPGVAELEQDDEVRVLRPRPLATRVPWFARDPARRHHPPFPDPGTVRAVRRIVRDHEPDLVHSYGWISYSVAAALRGSGVPLLLSARDYAYICAVRTYLHVSGSVCSGPGLRKCLSCATQTHVLDEAGDSVSARRGLPINFRHRARGAAKGLVAVSSVWLGKPLLLGPLRGLHSASTFVRTVMDRHLLGTRAQTKPAVVSQVIPNFILEDPGSSPDKQALARLPSQPFILYVGALLPSKGIWQLFEAYGRLRDPKPPLVLLGPSYHTSPTSFPDGVHAPGAVSGATVLAAWDRALFGVVPSIGAETFGNVITEAMSRGRAVVASELGGIVDIVQPGVTGELVPPGDVPSLAAAMQRLLDDPALTRRLGDGARAASERYGVDPIISRLEALYLKVARVVA